MLPQLIAALRVCPRYYASLGSHDPNASVVEYPQWVKFLDDFKLYKKGYVWGHATCPSHTPAPTLMPPTTLALFTGPLYTLTFPGSYTRAFPC